MIEIYVVLWMLFLTVYCTDVVYITDKIIDKYFP